MSKPTKSQWDFGELFPAEETRKVLSVSELTTQVKRLLEKQVGLTKESPEMDAFVTAQLARGAAELRDMLARPCPGKNVGRHCFEPFPCEFFAV